MLLLLLLLLLWLAVEWAGKRRWVLSVTATERPLHCELGHLLLCQHCLLLLRLLWLLLLLRSRRQVSRLLLLW